MTVEFRQSRGGPVVTALMADASLGDIGTAYPWRTFRWYMGQKHYSGWYWSTVWGLAEAEGLVLQNDSWVAGVGEHSRW